MTDPLKATVVREIVSSPSVSRLNDDCEVRDRRSCDSSSFLSSQRAKRDAATTDAERWAMYDERVRRKAMSETVASTGEGWRDVNVRRPTSKEGLVSLQSFEHPG